MIRYNRRVWVLAACLSALAGYVDALGFLATSGRFVSFMSGNTTRLSVELAGGSMLALSTAGVIVCFVAGVVVGSFIGHLAGKRRRPLVLMVVSMLLAAAAGFNGAGVAVPAIFLTALAMGAENTVFERDGEVSIGLTYMTGTLVKVGQRLTAALMGGPRWAWLPYLLLWMGLAFGAMLGALVYPHLGLAGLWFAAPAAAGLAGISALFDRQ